MHGFNTPSVTLVPFLSLYCVGSRQSSFSLKPTSYFPKSLRAASTTSLGLGWAAFS